MDYKQKYIKYKKKYFEIKSTHLIQSKNITGGNISWATKEYIENIILTQIPDKSKCNIIKNIKTKKTKVVIMKVLDLLILKIKNIF
jgi:hypothetical protein